MKDDSGIPKRSSIKTGYIQRAGSQESRRKALLELQRQRRYDLKNHARKLLQQNTGEAEEDDDEAVEFTEVISQQLPTEKLSNRRDKRQSKSRSFLLSRRDKWCHELCWPEWLLQIPSGLNGKGSETGEGWFVVPRPEGKRLLVVASNGWTTARELSGAVIDHWRSALPGGSRGSGAGKSSGGEAPNTILDCILHPVDGVIYVLDVMSWRDLSLYECSTEFRFYWARTKIAETGVGELSENNQKRICTLPYQDSHPEGLLWVYKTPLPFIRDGLLFYSKSATYCLGPTPLVLLWKDEPTTRYLRQEGTPSIVLMTRISGEITTEEVDHHMEDAEDGPIHGKTQDAAVPCEQLLEFVTGDLNPVVMKTVTSDVASTLGVKPGDLVRFYVDSELKDEDESDFANRELQFCRICSSVKPAADTLSKAIFQSAVQSGNGRIFIEDLERGCQYSSKTEKLEASQI
eukprot:486558_1